VRALLSLHLHFVAQYKFLVIIIIIPTATAGVHAPLTTIPNIDPLYMLLNVSITPSGM